MATVDLVMPKMGESIMEATILKWHKNPGDAVKMDETVLEIATDKVDTEVPSTVEGILEELLFQVNDVVPVGSVIARIKTGAPVAMTQGPTNGGDYSSNDPNHQWTPAPQPLQSAGYQTASTVQPSQSPAYNGTPSSNGARFYSPLVLNIAQQEGVSMTELERIAGTGNEGRVTKSDILQYVSNKKAGRPQPSAPPVQAQPSYNQPASQTTPASIQHTQAQQSTPTQTPPQVQPQPATAQTPVNQPLQTPARKAEQGALKTPYSGNVEIIEMDRMRKLIADHMVRSKHTSPHVTSFTEADVTNLVQWRERIKKDFEKREGTRITFTPLFVEAVVRCIKKFPMVNASVDGDRIIIKKDINIGMATALPSGNLIVPVIRNADGFNLVGLAKQVNALAEGARNNKLKPEDIAEGTFTLTNVGTFGSLMGTPIINQPQVAILAVGAIKKRPVVVESPHGDSIAIRHMMYLSLSYDHRIVDGSLGATFLTAVANELENFNAEREY